MKLISLNVELNRHTKAVLEFLKKEDPDVIAVQELLEEEFSLYKKELGLEGVFQVCRYVHSSNYTDSIGKKMGVAIFAKHIIQYGSDFYIGESTFLDKFNTADSRKTEAVLWVDVSSMDNQVYRFVTAHLPVTKDGVSTPEQLSDLDALFTKLDTFGEFTLSGDMNAPRGRDTFTRLTEKYQDNIPPEYKTSIDQNLHRVKNIQYMVDGLFTTPLYKASDVKLVDGLSDHMAIVAHITHA